MPVLVLDAPGAVSVPSVEAVLGIDIGVIVSAAAVDPVSGAIIDGIEEVVAGIAVHDVVPVAAVDLVVAIAAAESVVVAVAVDSIVAVVAVHRVLSVVAGQRVVPIAAA